MWKYDLIIIYAFQHDTIFKRQTHIYYNRIPIIK